ncbi:MAG: gluconolaconase [Acidobacteria bacterium]|nr:gluconolaconase [Acidobacteriota bacterium]
MPLKKPQITQVQPPAAIPGGEFQIRGSGLLGADRPRVWFGDAVAPVIVGSESMLIARVPEGAAVGPMVIESDRQRSSPWMCEIGIQVTDGLHPVANPAVDAAGTVYSTFSGSRGQKTPVSVYRIDPHMNMRPFLSDLMNTSGLAIDREGLLYVSSRLDGIIYQVTPEGEMSLYVEGMGVATGIAFDKDENLYVGDRQGTVFKISRTRQIYVFATLEQSIAAYHFAFGPDGYLYVCGPTTSSYDAVQRISPAGEVEVFYRGLGRPQGLAFDADGRLYVAASLRGRRGIVRLSPDGQEAEMFVSGPNIVGLAFAPGGLLYIATTSALYRLNAGVRGLPMANLDQ